MKKINLLTAFLATTPLITSGITMTSCSNGSNKVFYDILRNTVNELIELNKTPRPALRTCKVRNYLMQRIEDLGYEAQTDFDSAEGGAEQSANVWFDVPATTGYEDHKKIIIQAHMDMIVAGLSEEQAYETPIEVEYHSDNHTLTSKDHKTSLGADNGIGVGLIFALLQTKSIKHGPIRFLFTADEEKGMLGAKRIRDEQATKNVLDADYLICLDGELDNEGYYRSCQGSCGYTFRKDFEYVSFSGARTCDILIDGFNGGHSGQDINKGRCNAIIFILSFLQELDGADSQIIKFNYQNGQSVDVAQNRNSIPSMGRIKIATQKSKLQIQEAFENTKTKFKSLYNGENWDNVKMSICNFVESEDVTRLNTTDVQKIIHLITNDENKGFVYGPYIIDPNTDRPLMSCNISNMYIDYSSSDQKMKFEVTTYARAVNKPGIYVLQNSLLKLWNNYVTDSDPTGEDVFQPIYPWEASKVDELQVLSKKGYESIGVTPTTKDSHGGIENAIFIEAKPTLQLTSLGTKFENVHTVNETCYLDPLVNTIKVLKYILENLK